MRIFFWGAGLVFVADRLTKVLASQFLESVPTQPIWPGIFHLTLVHNTGVAFGMFKNAGFWIAVLPVVSVLLILVFFLRQKPAQNKLEFARHWAWAVIAGGALGNAYDRIFIGAVIDFLDFRIWPVFNVADSAIVCGAVMVAWMTFLHKEPTR